MLKSKIFVLFAAIFAFLAIFSWAGFKSQTVLSDSSAANGSRALSANFLNNIFNEAIKEQEADLSTRIKQSELLYDETVQSLHAPHNAKNPGLILTGPLNLPNIDEAPSAINFDELRARVEKTLADSDLSKQTTSLSLISIANANILASNLPEEANRVMLRLRQGNRPSSGMEFFSSQEISERWTWTCNNEEKELCILSVSPIVAVKDADLKRFYTSDGAIIGISPTMGNALNLAWEEMKAKKLSSYSYTDESGQVQELASIPLDSKNAILFLSPRSVEARAASLSQDSLRVLDYKSLAMAILAGLFVFAVGLLVIRRDLIEQNEALSKDIASLSASPAHAQIDANAAKTDELLNASKTIEDLERRLKATKSKLVQLEEQFGLVREAYQGEKKHREALSLELEMMQANLSQPEPTMVEAHPIHLTKPFSSSPVPAPAPFELLSPSEIQYPKKQIDTEEVTNREMDAILDSSSSALSADFKKVEKQSTPLNASTRITSSIETDEVENNLGESEWNDIVASFDSIMDASFMGAGALSLQLDDTPDPASTLANFGMQKAVSEQRKPIPPAFVKNPGSERSSSSSPSSPAVGSPIPALNTNQPRETLNNIAGLRKQSSPSIPLTPFPQSSSSPGDSTRESTFSGQRLNTLTGSQKAISRVEAGETAMGLAALQKEAPSSHPLFERPSTPYSDTTEIPVNLASAAHRKVEPKKESGSFKPAPSWTGKKIQDKASVDSNTLLDALKRRTRDVSHINLDPVKENNLASPETPSLSKSGVFSVTGSRVDIDPLNDTEYFKSLYDKFIETKIACGESTDKLTLDRFMSRLARNKESLMQTYKCKTVKFQVYVKDGKTALKATPVM